MKADILGMAALGLCLLLAFLVPAGNGAQLLAPQFSVFPAARDAGKPMTTGLRSIGPLFALASSPAQRHAHR